MEYWEHAAYKIKLFSILLWHSQECEKDIANCWPEFNPDIPEEEVEFYPEEFKIWFVDNKYEDLYELRFLPLEDDYWDDHEIVYFFKDSVTTDQLHSLNLFNVATRDNGKIEDFDGYRIREDGQLYMLREMDLRASMDWLASSDCLEDFYNDLKRKQCEEYNLPEELISSVGIWG